MLVVVNVWTVAFFLSNLLQCIPISVNWTGWGGAANSCVDTNTMFLAQAWSDVVTDGIHPPVSYGKQLSDMLDSANLVLALTMCNLRLPHSKAIANNVTDLAASHANVTKD